MAYEYSELFPLGVRIYCYAVYRCIAVQVPGDREDATSRRGGQSPGGTAHNTLGGSKGASFLGEPVLLAYAFSSGTRPLLGPTQGVVCT